MNRPFFSGLDRQSADATANARGTRLGRAPTQPPGQTIPKSITVDGTTRQYNVYVPSSYNPSNPAPVVLALHGGKSNAAQMQRSSGFDAVAEKEGFIVVYPEAVNGNWNDGRPSTGFSSAQVDDVQFISSVIDQVGQEFTIDPDQVFATGVSNGGMMSHRLGMELSDKVSAIAPVAASIPTPLGAQNLDPENPVSVMMINGTRDPAVQYTGNSADHQFLGTTGVPTQSVPMNVNTWIRYNNGLAGRPERFVVPDRANDQTRTTGTSFETRNGAQVVQLTVHNGGHGLPGTRQYLPPRLIGNISQDFNGAQVIWNFFEQNGRDD